MLGKKSNQSSVLILLGFSFITAACADKSVADIEHEQASFAFNDGASIAALRILGGNGQVGPVGSQLPQKITVRAVNGGGNVVRGATVVFAVTVGGGSVSPREVMTDELGRAAATWTLGPQVGTNRVRASAGNVAVIFEARATEAPRPLVASLVLTPSAVTLDSVGARATLTATTHDINGQVVTGQHISWSSSNPLIASVDSTGLVIANSAGTARVVANAVCCNKADTAVVTVNSAPPPPPPPSPVLTTITLSPGSASIAVGATQTFTATARDQNGNIMTGVSYTWSSSNTSVITVSQGTVTGVAAGVATVRATSGSVSGAAQVTVSTSPLPPSTGQLNEPAGMSIFVNENGTRRDFGANWWKSAKWLNDQYTEVVDDPANPAGSGKAIEKRWYAGDPTDNGNGLTEIQHFPFAARELYIRYRIRYSANWDTRPNYDTPKLGYWGAFGPGGPTQFWIKAPPNHPVYFYEQAGSNSVFGWGSGAKRVQVGTWHTIEVHIVAQTAVDAPNGSVKVWLDGELQINKGGLNLIDADDGFSSTLFDGVQVFFIRGTAGSTFSVNDWLRLGELYISGKT